MESVSPSRRGLRAISDNVQVSQQQNFSASKSLIKGFLSPTSSSSISTRASTASTSATTPPPLPKESSVPASAEKFKRTSPHPSSSSTKASGLYEVTFPPGPMGLELEPVIISSERRLGCRIKDFYFGLDHQGIEAVYLQSKVNIGDVISHVNGKSLLSQKFDEILELLRTMKNTSRVIVFKNISASCKSYCYHLFVANQ